MINGLFGVSISRGTIEDCACSQRVLRGLSVWVRGMIVACLRAVRRADHPYVGGIMVGVVMEQVGHDVGSFKHDILEVVGPGLKTMRRRFEVGDHCWKKKEVEVRELEIYGKLWLRGTS